MTTTVAKVIGGMPDGCGQTAPLKRFGLFAELGEAAFFPTVGAAVSSYIERHDVEWVDDDAR